MLPGIVTVLQLVLSTVPVTSHALSSDREQPINIKADTVEIDSKSSLAVYHGNVEVRQGTLHIKGTRLVIEWLNDKVKMITVTGRPAHYRQRPDNQSEDITASANRLQIHPELDLVRMEHNARITRGDSVFTGNIIEYNSKHNTIRAKGNAATGAGTGRVKDRIHMTIQPKE